MLSNHQNLFFNEKNVKVTPHQEMTDETYEFTFLNNNKDHLYEKDKQSIQQRIRDYGLREDIASFDDKNTSIKFKYLSQVEITYIFGLWPFDFTNKRLLGELLSIMKITKNRDYERYLQSQYDAMEENSKAYANQYEIALKESRQTTGYRLEIPGFTQSAAAIFQLMRNNNNITPLLENHDTINHLVISEAHNSPKAKAAIMHHDSIAFLVQTQGVILLEHLCLESMQAELDQCIANRVLSPILTKYLQTLDKRQHTTAGYGFCDLVSTLVKNGISIFAADTQQSYNTPTDDNWSDGVAQDRQMVNVEWKKRVDEIRRKRPNSPIISVVGSGHSTTYMQNNVTHYERKMIAYDELVNCVHWPIDCYYQPNTLTFYVNQSIFQPVAPVILAKQFPVLSPHFFKSQNTLELTQLMQYHFIFKTHAEREQAVNKIKQYKQNCSLNDDNDIFLIGRIPKELLSTFSEKLNIDLGAISTEPSAYTGQDNNHPIIHLNIKIRKEELDKILTMDSAILRSALSDICLKLEAILSTSSSLKSSSYKRKRSN